MLFLLFKNIIWDSNEKIQIEEDNGEESGFDSICTQTLVMPVMRAENFQENVSIRVMSSCAVNWRNIKWK